METARGNSAAINAISIRDLGVLAMTKDQLDREMNYRAARASARSMLLESIITQDELLAIDTILIDEFRPVIGGLIV